MGLLDSASDMFGGKPPPGGEPADSRLIQAALALLADSGQNGGLRGLVEHFQEAGLGNTISSWIGSGENVPITAQQIREALGGGQLQQISEEAGLSEDETADRLSQLLPTLIDTLTPAGHLPEGGLASIGAALERFLGRQP
jgi:uncharacterized protein YidB (DUF937 family)